MVSSTTHSAWHMYSTYCNGIWLSAGCYPSDRSEPQVNAPADRSAGALSFLRKGLPPSALLGCRLRRRARRHQGLRLGEQAEGCVELRVVLDGDLVAVERAERRARELGA